MSRVWLSLISAAFWLQITGCSECSGTPWCTVQPIMSGTGQLIDHKTGANVVGARVEFVPRSGIPIGADTVRGMSDTEGFFRLEAGSVYTGEVRGDLIVTPPPPYKPYTATDIVMSASRNRGDGTFLGRFVADPYLIMVGELHNAQGGLEPNATVVFRRLSGGRIAKDRATFVTDGGGRFGWIEPAVLDYGPIHAEFDITLSDGRRFQILQDVPILYRDQVIAFVLLSLS
jgi:hypothetical protein